MLFLSKQYYNDQSPFSLALIALGNCCFRYKKELGENNKAKTNMTHYIDCVDIIDFAFHAAIGKFSNHFTRHLPYF